MQFEDALLHVDRHFAACAKGRGSSDRVTTVTIRVFGRTGTNAFDPHVASESFRGNFGVTVHERDQWGLRLVLHDESLDDTVLAHF